MLVKNPPANDIKDVGSIPGLGRSPGEGHGNPLQYSCLENSMDRGAWQGPWGRKESDTTEVTEHARTHTLSSTPVFLISKLKLFCLNRKLLN